jgi:plastocyanin
LPFSHISGALLTRRSVVSLLLLVLGLFACNKKQEPGQLQNSDHPIATVHVDPATAATISGTVSFDGTAPAPVKIDMSEDPGCKGENYAETFLVNDGKLANVFVYIKSGLQGEYEVPKPAVIDQSGCRYHPHVLGVMTGQKIVIKNDDSTLHNVHAMAQDNKQWNLAQLAGGPAIQTSFANPEIMLPLECNLHPWMKMYVNVANNPFFAVSGQDGSYEIAGLPPGDYTLAFVHERLGEQDRRVTLSPKEHKIAGVSFKL